MIKVDKFIFPTNYIGVDMKEDKDVPIIMRWPFLTSGCIIIDVAARVLIMLVYNESVMIKVFKQSDYFDDIMACLEEDQYENSKCASCFVLMATKRKKKRQKSMIKLGDLIKSSNDDQANTHHLPNSHELLCSADSSESTNFF